MTPVPSCQAVGGCLQITILHPTCSAHEFTSIRQEQAVCKNLLIKVLFFSFPSVSSVKQGCGDVSKTVNTFLSVKWALTSMPLLESVRMTKPYADGGDASRGDDEPVICANNGADKDRASILESGYSQWQVILLRAPPLDFDWSLAQFLRLSHSGLGSGFQKLRILHILPYICHSSIRAQYSSVWPYPWTECTSRNCTVLLVQNGHRDQEYFIVFSSIFSILYTKHTCSIDHEKCDNALFEVSRQSLMTFCSWIQGTDDIL